MKKLIRDALKVAAAGAEGAVHAARNEIDKIAAAGTLGYVVTEAVAAGWSGAPHSLLVGGLAALAPVAVAAAHGFADGLDDELEALEDGAGK